MQPASPLAKEMLRVTNFIARLPVDDIPSSEPTEVYLGYDSANLYSIFVCFDSHPETMRARRPSRDAVFEDDSVTIQLDTFHDQQRAYSFGVNAGGIQGDAVWTEGQGWDPNFDTVYHSEVKRMPQGYIVFMAIPFRSLRFPTAPRQEWGILLNRYIARTREDTFWPRYTQRIQGRTNQMGTLEGLSEISSGKNFQIVPYTAFVNSKLLETNDGSPTVFKQNGAEFRGGMDLKAVWHDKLTFDMTANPDFSQVEADDPQVLVNQRFQVFFPEKRLFFLENSSYFQTPIQLLFTRTIVKPDAGTRITGKLGNYGIGLLFADDRATGEALPTTDPDSGRRAFTNVARITRDLRPQTYVGTSVVHYKFGEQENLTLGADTLIKLTENWRANSQVVVSRTQDHALPAAAGEALYGGLFEDSQHWIAHLEYNDRSPNFRADAGFIPRVDYRGLTNLLQYNFRAHDSKLVRWGPLLNTAGTWDYSGQNLDWLFGPGLQFEFKRNTNFEFTSEFGGMSLRPADFSAITNTSNYQLRSLGGRIASTPVNSVSFDLTLATRRAVNFFPAVGPPVNVSSLAGSATVGLRPSSGLTIDNTYLFTQLEDEHSNHSVFNDHILRTRWLYQFDQRWSLRFTAQCNFLVVNRALTSLQPTKQLNGDVLLAYRLNPATAFFIGYNYDVQNYDPTAVGSLPPLARLNRGLINDGRVLFVKVSYLFRY
ncbi:MAG TPA: DUF5916 domain-containing protein [Terriglobales bacterium]|nr:DUF5916 domain-containing protein [Terriglobales bacterium]